MIKRNNVYLITSVFVAVVWINISIYTMTLVGEPIDNDAGTAIVMALMMPYLIVSCIGTILHAIGGFVYKRGLVLAGLIIECVSLLLGITWGFGFILAIILGFIGYAKMRKEPL